MLITNSLQWQEIDTQLSTTIKALHNEEMAMQARKMLTNFNAMITKLSKLEMEARTSASGSKRRVNEQLEIINTEVENFQQWLTLLMLMK